MFDPNVASSPVLDISYVVSVLRDLGIFVTVLIVGWNARSWFQDVKDFTTSISRHMTKMEGFAYRMEHNHAKHIQEYLYQIAKDRNIITVMDPEIIADVTDPVDPPENEV
jgi:hypothetical protein